MRLPILSPGRDIDEIIFVVQEVSGATSDIREVLPKEKDLSVAECPEVGAVSQRYSVGDAVANLKEATEPYLEESTLAEVTRPLLTTFEVAVNA
jgi:predicted RNase H-like HicB family nuclease